MIYHDFSPTARQVIDATLDEVTRRYGDGVKPGSLASYPYHNLNHALSVMEGAIELSIHLNLSRAAIELAAMSGTAHDVIREHIDNVTPEQASAVWLGDTMRTYGYSDADISVTTAAILATTASLNEHGVLISQVHDIDRETESGKVALSVASADLRALYIANGPHAAHDYFRELRGLSGAEIPTSLDGLHEYQEGEVALTRAYRYPFAAAEELFASRRDSIVAHHQLILESLNAGKIHDWRDIEALDQAYYDHHSLVK